MQIVVVHFFQFTIVAIVTVVREGGENNHER